MDNEYLLKITSRNVLYEMLHALYAFEPKQKILTILKSDTIKDAISLFFETEVAEKFNADIESLPVKDYINEYNELFIGPGTLAAPPWESAYFDEKRSLFNEVTLRVQSWYKTYGFKIATDKNVPSDHIALELDFLSHLSKQTIELEQAEDEHVLTVLEVQANFIDEHLKEFSENILQAIKDNYPDGLYDLVTRLLVVFIKQDSKFLNEIIVQKAILQPEQ